MRIPLSRPASWRAFTLPEMIIVISIMAILAGLLLTGWRKAAETADSAKCVQNLRTNGQISLMFFAENGGDFFTAQSWFRQDMRIRGDLGAPSGADYLQDTILTCQTVKKAYPHLFPRDMNQCYAKNFFLNIYHTSSTYANLPTRPLSGGPGNLRSVPKLSAMWMFTDSGHIGPEGGGQIAPEWRRQEYGDWGFLHNKRRNTVFMDGHVEALTRQQWENPPSPREFWGELALPR